MDPYPATLATLQEAQAHAEACIRDAAAIFDLTSACPRCDAFFAEYPPGLGCPICGRPTVDVEAAL